MIHTEHPYRSVLFVPAAKPRALAKIPLLACDAVIVDLEDSVAPDQKDQARQNLLAYSAQAKRLPGRFLVRVNDTGSSCFLKDVKAALQAGSDGIVLSKTASASDLARLEQVTKAAGNGDIPIWAMIETSGAVLNLPRIAEGSPRLAGLILGSNDLITELGAIETPDRTALASAIGLVVLTARAYGLICLDGVYNNFGDEDGFAAACQQGRIMGFDGKTLIHPKQIAAANEAFTPSQQEVEQANNYIRAFEAAQKKDEGITSFEGVMLEELHIKAARALLAKAAMIEKLARRAAQGGTAE